MKTEWFDPKVRPPWVPGVYERQSPTGGTLELFSRWDGVNWRQNAYTAELAEESHIISQWQDLPWRGLTCE